MWGAWSVKGIDPDRLILSVGGSGTGDSLVADFSAPQESPQVAEARALQQAAQKHQRAARQAVAAQQDPTAARYAGGRREYPQARDCRSGGYGKAATCLVGQ